MLLKNEDFKRAATSSISTPITGLTRYVGTLLIHGSSFESVEELMLLMDPILTPSNSSSVKSRLQYLGPNPSLPRISEHQSEEEVRLDPSIGPVAAFCLLVLDPDQRESTVDFVSVSKAMRWTHNGIPGMYMVDVE
ncbi:hypothetical protein J1N35_036281 [Gossypium stocksii]|uniref:Uncharacterized protein n=1 Tax=Gossypium stocksii TaxID=47602 RepID=A0A9D3ZKN7_9ROSI|nr:hypothetical protein J1N35_036281 [Gossypium stocksii]